MNSLRPLLICLSFSFCLLFPGTDVLAFTLEDAIRKALEVSPTLKKAQADSAEARAYARETKSDLLPQLSLEGMAGPSYRDRSIDGVSTGGESLFSRSLSLVGRQLLFDNGYSRYRWKDAQERTAAIELLERNDAEAIALEAAEAFLDVRRGREQVKLAKGNLAVHENILKLAEERRDSAGNKADVELATARLSLAKTSLKERLLDLEQAASRFVRLVDEKPPANLELTTMPSIPSLESVNAMGNWQYRAGLLQLKAANLEKRSVEGLFSPKFYLQGTGGLGEDVLGIEGRDNEASGLIVGSWPLFEGGRKKALVGQADAEISRQQSLINENLRMLVQDIRSRWEDYSTIGERIRILESYSSELGNVVKLYEEQFQLGRRPLLSMLDIQNEETSAAMRLSDERRDRLALGYRLWALSGQLVSKTLGHQLQPSPRGKIPVTEIRTSSALTPARLVSSEPVQSKKSPPAKTRSTSAKRTKDAAAGDGDGVLGRLKPRAKKNPFR